MTSRSIIVLKSIFNERTAENKLNKSQSKNNPSAVSSLITSTVEDLGLELWDVEYVKEGSLQILRIYIDKNEGISTDDCEAVSRAVDPIIEKNNLFGDCDYLEVSSPGLERALVKPSHFEKYISEKVIVKLYAPINNAKSIEGILESYNDGAVTINTGDTCITLEKDKYSKVNLKFDF